VNRISPLFFFFSFFLEQVSFLVSMSLSLFNEIGSGELRELGPSGCSSAMRTFSLLPFSPVKILLLPPEVIRLESCLPPELEQVR